MRADIIRKQRAIKLRQKGMSIKSIAKTLPAAVSSVSIWVREVELTTSQKLKLKNNTHSKSTIKRRRNTRLNNESRKREVIIDRAAKTINALSSYELTLICSALYWAEGTKKRGAVQFANGDPEMIKLMLIFLRQVCKTPESKLRGHIHIHEHLDVVKAEKYWQHITRISQAQFYKTYNKPNKSSKNTRKSLPYGVCTLYVLDTHLFLEIVGWTKGIRNAGISIN